MEEKTNISVILPVHEINPEIEKYFGLAVASINNQIILPDELLIVVAPNADLLAFVEGFDYGQIKPNVRIITNNGPTDFPSQFNLGVKEAKSEWVSLLETDDEFSKIWVNNVIKYREAYPEINVFLPIIVDVLPNGQFASICNEPVWAAEFCDELGLLDIQALHKYQNFNFDGMVIRKKTIEEFYGIKSSIKLTFVYEFLLRMAHYDAKIMVIPKIGYKHVNQRENSIFRTCKEKMTPDEIKWWFAQAKKEFYFTHDNRTPAYSAEAAEKL